MYVLGFIISSQQYEIDTTTFKKHDAEKTANIKWLCPYHEHGRRTSTAFDASSFTETGTPVPNPESQNGALHCSINLQHIRAFAIKSQEVLQHISGMTGRLILRCPCPNHRPTGLGKRHCHCAFQEHTLGANIRPDHLPETAKKPAQKKNERSSCKSKINREGPQSTV